MKKWHYIYGMIMITLAFGSSIAINLRGQSYHLAALSFVLWLIITVSLTFDYSRRKK